MNSDLDHGLEKSFPPIFQCILLKFLKINLYGQSCPS